MQCHVDDPIATFRICHHSRATSSMAAALICVERMICQAVDEKSGLIGASARRWRTGSPWQGLCWVHADVPA
jgi:hypothetical protein